MEALDTVLQELVRPYSPHYLFGGASLTGTEPHAFVAYVCLRALTGLEEVLQQRAREHKKLSHLLEEINEWLEQSGPTGKIHHKPEWFAVYVETQAAQTQEPSRLDDADQGFRAGDCSHSERQATRARGQGLYHETPNECITRRRIWRPRYGHFLARTLRHPGG